MKRKLGTMQRSILCTLSEHNNGKWYPGCGWIWDNVSGTKRLLDSLIKHGHVERSESDRGWRTNSIQRLTVWTITESGKAEAAKGRRHED